ncbi:MAG: hypothetical protein IPM45_15875 [Acidimicrobiales bacterium]|nr:hypothetical protein [Acidimicrobiales bacterium]
MSAGWVAGSVRARLLARRRLGRDGARDLAAARTPAQAVAALARSPYGRDVDPSMTALAARHALAATTLWHLRVLAGWLGPPGAEIVRLLAGGFEIADVEALLTRLAGGSPEPTYDLGALAVAWPRIRQSTGPAEVRAALAASPWGDPGGTDPADIGVALRLAWARRVADGVEPAADWAVAGAALVVAREALVHRRALTPVARVEACRLLGPRWEREPWATPEALAALVSPAARAALEGTSGPDQLWRAEARWVRRVDDDALLLVGSGRPGPALVVGAVALLLVDAWRARAALEACAWGERGREVLDAVG